MQELQERYKNNTSVIEYLLGQVGSNVDVLPSQIQGEYNSPPFIFCSTTEALTLPCILASIQ